MYLEIFVASLAKLILIKKLIGFFDRRIKKECRNVHMSNYNGNYEITC